MSAPTPVSITPIQISSFYMSGLKHFSIKPSILLSILRHDRPDKSISFLPIFLLSPVDDTNERWVSTIFMMTHHDWGQCSAVQCSDIQCSTVQWSAFIERRIHCRIVSFTGGRGIAKCWLLCQFFVPTTLKMVRKLVPSAGFCNPDHQQNLWLQARN